MAIKTLSNGRIARPTPGLSDFSSGHLEWARSVSEDPLGHFIVLMAPAPLVFLRGDRQLGCLALIASSASLGAQARPERLINKIGFALREAEAINAKKGTPAHLTRPSNFNSSRASDSSALGEIIIVPSYPIDNLKAFFSDAPMDPRKRRRLARQKEDTSPPTLRDNANDNDDPDWEELFQTIASALKRRGFGVEMAPWIIQEWAGRLQEREHREEARALFESQRIDEHMGQGAPSARLKTL